MIITLFFIVMIIIGIIAIKIDFINMGEFLISAGISVFCLIICLMLIIGNYITATRSIEKNHIEYESLCKRLEIINSEYEDISKSDVIKDIAEWNKDVYEYHYWTENPFTNWFYNKKVADSYKYIEIGE